MSRLYEREIKDFFEVAKIKMAGTTKEAKGKFGKSYSLSLPSFVTCSSLKSNENVSEWFCLVFII